MMMMMMLMIPKTPYLNYQDPVMFTHCAGCSAWYVGETNRNIDTRVPEHLTSDRTRTSFSTIMSQKHAKLFAQKIVPQLKSKEALHIGWESPPLNNQVNHVNLSVPCYNTHCFISLYFLVPRIHVVI